MLLGRTLCRTLSLCLAACAAWLPAQTFDLDAGRAPIVSLDGPWRFHPGDSPSQALPSDGQPTQLLWASPAFDDSAWPLLEGGRSWSTQGYRGMSGFG